MLTSVFDGREFQRVRARSLVDRCCTVVDDSFAMMQSQVIAEGKLGKLPTSPKTFRSEEENVGERHVLSDKSPAGRPVPGVLHWHCHCPCGSSCTVLYFAAECSRMSEVSFLRYIITQYRTVRYLPTHVTAIIMDHASRDAVASTVVHH